MLPLSVAIITKNEAENLPRLLASLEPLKPAEIVVVDSGSTDGTVAIAKAHGARVIETNWPGYGEQKNRALDACQQNWVLSLDADEPISRALANNIRDLFAAGDPDSDGYEINRRTWYLGAWLEYVWSPEWRLRLARKQSAQWTADSIHERMRVYGTITRLPGDIHHYSYRDLSDHFQRMIVYARTGAETLAQKHDRFPWHKLVFSPTNRFLRILVIQRGWRDGWRGWIIAGSSMISAFMKYAFLYELIIKKEIKIDPPKI